MAAIMLPTRPAILLLGVFALSAQLRQDGFQSTLGHLAPKTNPEVQEKAASDVVERLLGKEKSQMFAMIVDPRIGPPGKDIFKITKNSMGKIEILGNSGVSTTWGLHYYLKNYCGVHVSWEGAQIDLPNTLPEVRIEITSNDRFRYYQNVCTPGYSFTWWQWREWEKHIDWMALNGFNLVLAFTGQEAIWERVYLQLNLSRSEIDEHFGGPAFLPWSRMGNIRGFGGPLTASWHNQTLFLQRQILKRMRDLGIIPVLPSFAGHVPRAFSRLFPSANMTMIDSWNKFEDKYCCPFLLEPSDPLFQTVGEMFLKEYIEEFGTDHIYNCDTFNENEPSKSDLSYLSNIGRSVFSVMQSVDPKAIWLMQGWLFVHDITFWTEPRVEAFLTSVPLGKMIVLDLQSEQFPQYARLHSYYGQPFIWCMLHNFGGTLGMFGSAEIINQRVFQARNVNGSTMVGTGLTPEGINQNYVIYELMNEMAYRRTPVDLDFWFENYATRRYGAWNEYAVDAWKMFGRTVYNFVGVERIRGHYVITSRPSLKINTWTWYNRETFFSAWKMLLRARHGRRNSTLYRHDVVDVTRQALQLTGDSIYVDLISAYDKGNVTALRIHASKLLEIFDDLESILASGKDFLLGRWLQGARSFGTNNQEKSSYEYNARNQITLWGPNGEIRDYANKQWSGVMGDYFKPRWALFLGILEESVVKNVKINASLVNERMFLEVERPFTLSTKIYPDTPIGDSIEIALQMIPKWQSTNGRHRNYRHSLRGDRRRRKNL